jgi:hypothetical protein
MSDHYSYQCEVVYLVVDNYLDEIKECSHMSPSNIKDIVKEGQIKTVPWIPLSDQITEFCPCE